MNVIKLIREQPQPVKLVRQIGQPVKLVRSQAQPVRLVNTGGVVNLGGASNAAQLPIGINLRTYYQLRKQL